MDEINKIKSEDSDISKCLQDIKDYFNKPNNNSYKKTDYVVDYDMTIPKSKYNNMKSCETLKSTYELIKKEVNNPNIDVKFNRYVNLCHKYLNATCSLVINKLN